MIDMAKDNLNAVCMEVRNWRGAIFIANKRLFAVSKSSEWKVSYHRCVKRAIGVLTWL